MKASGEKRPLSVRRWESEKLKSRGMSVEGFPDHVTDGSLLGVPGRRCACGWSVVQFDHDEEMGPMHGMYGTLYAELEVQRTIKRAELKAFLSLLRGMGRTTAHVDSKGITDGCCGEET